MKTTGAAVLAGLLLVACASQADAPPSGIQASASHPSPTAGLTSPAPSKTPEVSPTEPVPSSRAWTARERRLLDGIRADILATSCRPLEDDDLPSGALAGVGCDVRSQLVDGVGFYQFESLEDLMVAYEARLAQYGIPLATDVPDIGQLPRDCWRGYPSESFYSPGGSAEFGMNREGCFVNELGFANLRYVWGGPQVYIGVLGNNDDIAALKAWSWYDEAGDEPDRGGPGVWQPPPP